MPVQCRLAELLACPRCDKPLSAEDEHYTCSSCKTTFPIVGDIPWLFADPESSLGEWRNRLHFALQQLAHDSQRLDAALNAGPQSALTRTRLEHLKNATDEHRNALRQLLEPVDVRSMQASYASYLALRTRLPSDQGLNTYYANVHRDWAWGDEENRLSLQQITSVLAADEGPGDALVLGAGAGRLAYDVHMQWDGGRTVAVDFNPLLFLTAKRLVDGGKLSLYEFPIAPASLQDVAVLRELSAPEPVGEDFFLVLADVLRAPFVEAGFDTVVTPWLIDIVAEDLPVFAARVNRLLKDGGSWINFGSLAFEHAEHAQRYSKEETFELIQSTGFSVVSEKEASIPYMCSPASRHGRQERVLTFSAAKTESIKAPPRHKALPDWIVTGKKPVPLLSSFRTQALSTQIFAFIMSLIDGKRTIEDMAKILEQQQLMSKEEALPAIRNFLIRMHDDAARNPSF